ncbi:hypothetical protein ES703_51253 [subsurface metagenome]|nr:PqqD family peptide modification chaperone [bacterium]
MNNYLVKRFVKDPNMVFRQIDDEMILVPIRRNVADLESIYTLNPLAARIWELIDGKRKIKDIKNVILQEYEVNEEKAEKDLLEFLTQLEEIKAVAASNA